MIERGTIYHIFSHLYILAKRRKLARDVNDVSKEVVSMFTRRSSWAMRVDEVLCQSYITGMWVHLMHGIDIHKQMMENSFILDYHIS